MGLVKLMVASVLMPVFFILPAWGADTADAEAHSAAPAVWKHQKVDFHYFGRTSRYSCEGLREKIRTLLIEVGARRDMRIQMSGCEIGRVSLGGLNPSLTVEFSVPFPRSAADKSNPLTEPKTFDARFEPFTFHRDAFRNLEVGDCELIEEFMRQILPKLATRSVTQNISCTPYQQSGGSYRVRGEVLRAVPSPADSGRGVGGADQISR